jgi:hypothetical protein
MYLISMGRNEGGTGEAEGNGKCDEARGNLEKKNYTV